MLESDYPTIEFVSLGPEKPDSVTEGERRIKWINRTNPAECDIELVYYGDDRTELYDYAESRERFRDAIVCAREQGHLTRPSFSDFSVRVFPVAEDGSVPSKDKPAVGVRRLFRILDYTS